MKKTLVLLIALLLTAAACGGGDGEPAESTPAPTSTTTASTSAPTSADSTAAPETTAAPDQPTTTTSAPTTGAPDDGSSGAGSETDFCRFIADVDDSQSGLTGTDPDAFRGAIEESVSLLRQARDIAPREVEDDVQFILGAFEDLVELFEEYEWNLALIGTQAANDPRLTAFDGSEFEERLQRIGDFCGLDLNAGGDDDPDPGTGGGAPVDGIPEALIPPGATQTLDLGAGNASISSSASFEDVVDHYTELLGEPFFLEVAQNTALWNTTYEGSQLTIALAAGPTGTVEVLVSLM